MFTIIKYQERFSMYLFISNFDQFFFRTGKNYLQLFLEQFKYVVKEKKMPEYISNKLEISSDDSDRKHSD